MAYEVNLEQQTAQQFVQQGGTILLLDVHEGTHMGVDQQVRTPFIELV